MKLLSVVKSLISFHYCKYIKATFYRQIKCLFLNMNDTLQFSLGLLSKNLVPTAFSLNIGGLHKSIFTFMEEVSVSVTVFL